MREFYWPTECWVLSPSATDQTHSSSSALCWEDKPPEPFSVAALYIAALCEGAQWPETHRYTVTLSVKPTLWLHKKKKKKRIVTCPIPERSFPDPCSGPEYSQSLESSSHCERTHSNSPTWSAHLTKTINTYTYIHTTQTISTTRCHSITPLTCISQCCFINACKY